MATLTSPTIQNQPTVAQPPAFDYLRFRLATPVECDTEFRQFMTCQISAAHVIPRKAGPTLKATQQGVLKLPAGVHYPLSDHSFYRGVRIHFEIISENLYEQERKVSLTKIYFKGFPKGITPQDVEKTFENFGKIQYVFMIKTKGQEMNSKSHGYFFFSRRSEVEKLLNYPGKLYFAGFRIKYDEFKSTVPGKRGQHHLASKPTKILKSVSELVLDTAVNQLHVRRASMLEPHSKAAMKLEFAPLQPRNQPHLQCCSKVSENLALPKNIRFNVVTGPFRTTMRSYKLKPVSSPSSTEFCSAIGTSVFYFRQ